MENSNDSDESDCEVYFQIPVREYDIAEKIKLSNQELFGDTNAASETKTIDPKPPKKSVKFREVLEEHAPKEEEYLCEYSLEHDDLISTSEPEEVTSVAVNARSFSVDSECNNSDIDMDIDSSAALIEELPFTEEALKQLVMINLNNGTSDQEIEVKSKMNALAQEMEMDDEIEDICENFKDIDVTNEESVSLSIQGLQRLSENKTNFLFPCVDNDNDNANPDNLLPKSETKTEYNKTKEFKPKRSIMKKTQKNVGFNLDLNQNNTAKRHCCRLKENVKLPGYEGVHSPYGLGVLQLERRNRMLKLQAIKTAKKAEQNAVKKREEEHINEAVFAEWMRMKAKATARKNKNMYDFNARKNADGEGRK